MCRLLNALYELKQASRQWNLKLTSALIQFDFVLSKLDYSLFTSALIQSDFVLCKLDYSLFTKNVTMAL